LAGAWSRATRPQQDLYGSREVSSQVLDALTANIGTVDIVSIVLALVTFVALYALIYGIERI
jgi:hypothetical protein